MGCPLSFDDYSSRYNACYHTYLDKFNLKPYYDRFNDLYVSRTYKWIEQLQNGFFVTMNIKRPSLAAADEIKYFKRTYPLCDNDFYLHLKKEKTIGIFPNAHFSKFLVFDIDSLDFNVTREVYSVIAQYFPENYININFSGTKGYHISLFFEDEIERNQLHNFFNLIVSQLDVSYSDIVECRGGLSEMAVKLPLGYNYAAKGSQEGLTYFVDSFGKKLPNEYLFQIQKIKVAEFEEVLQLNLKHYQPNFRKNGNWANNVKSKKDVMNYSMTQQEYIEKAKKNGIDAVGKRHKIMFQIAISLKLEGFSELQTIEYLHEWHKKLSPELYSSSVAEIEKDIKYTVRNVYRNSKYSIQKNKYIKFSKFEIAEILSVKDSVLRHLYFVLFCQAKSFGINGNFAMTYKQMELVGVSKNRARVKLHLLELEKLGKIKIVQCNKFKEFSERENETDWKHPNVYRLLCFQEKSVNQDNIEYKLSLENLHKNFLECVAKKVFIPQELKQFYNKNQITKIKKLDDFIELSRFDLNFLEIQEVNSIQDKKLKVLYLALILNCKYEAKKSQNIFDFSGFSRIFGIQKNKSLNDYMQLTEELQNLGKIKILKFSRFFFEYELVQFKEVKIDVKSDINVLEKFRS